MASKPKANPFKVGDKVRFKRGRVTWTVLDLDDELVKYKDTQEWMDDVSGWCHFGHLDLVEPVKKKGRGK